MNFGSNPRKHWIIPAVLFLLAMIAACEISPRREVVNNPQVSPTPTVSPTPFGSPTPTISPTPTPIPTATPMSTGVPTEFLFTADPDAGVILGFRINSDGGLSAVPGSPFVATNSPKLVAAVGSNLLVADQKTLSAFVISKETGKITRTDSKSIPSISNLAVDPVSGMAIVTTPRGQAAVQMINNKLQISFGSAESAAAIPAIATASKPLMDASRQFAYAIDSSKGEISAFRVDNGKMSPLSPAAYPAGHGSVSLAIVMP